jgi:hypothetical protein
MRSTKLVKILLQTWILDECIGIVFDNIQQNFCTPIEFTLQEEMTDFLDGETVFILTEDLDQFESACKSHGVSISYTGNTDYEYINDRDHVWHELQRR